MNLAEAYKVVKPSVIGLAYQHPSEDDKNKIWFELSSSGVCVDPSGIFVTAKHCVVDDKRIRSVKEINFHIIRSWISNEPSFKVLYFQPTSILVSEKYDVAVMKIPSKKDINFPYIKMPSKFEINEGDSVGCSGYPVTSGTRIDVYPNLFSGIISQISFQIIDKELYCDGLVLDMTLHPGNSGGPIFNLNGELIAIVSQQENRAIKQIEDPNNVHDRKLVWTNLLHCVPYTIFNSMVEQIKRENN